MSGLPDVECGPRDSNLSAQPHALDAAIEIVNAPPLLRERPDSASWLRFAGIAIVGLFVDLWTKNWAFDTLRQNERMELIPHVLEFQTMLNKGALFGIGPGQTALFVIASVLATGLVVWMFLQTPRSRRLLQIALGALLAGALGNMYDRIKVRLAEKPDRTRGVFMQVVGTAPNGRVQMKEYGRGDATAESIEPPVQVGFVRDFIKIPTKWFGGHDVWPWVFNVADMLLVGGVAVLALYLWFDRKRPGPAPQAATA